MSRQISFGRWLKRRRNELGLSQQELIERIDCSLALLRKLEADERRPSRQIALLLAAQLGVPPDEQAAFVTFARSAPPNFALSADEASDDPADAAPWRNWHLGKSNLPAALTRLIGRQHDSDAVRELLLGRYVRLLTLTGPPGIGKTSLALTVAESLIDEFEDGVYLVELAAVEEPEGVLPAIEHSLGLREGGAAAWSELRDKRMLLVLDNFEHLLDAGPAVLALLKASPWLKALVTSREALHVRSERQYAVSPLGLPEAKPAAYSNPALLAQNPAIALFVERAAEVAPHFALTAQNAADIATICVTLDGLPLAIELAAGSIGWLAPEQIRAALQNRLQLLTGGSRDLPPRQRTLRGAIEWSYALLEADEQRLFARLGVFVGGCSLAAALAVTTGADSALEGNTVAGAPTLEALIAKNLLSLVAATPRGTDTPGEARLTMLQTIREYAVEQLRAAGEEAAIRERHARYYLTQAEAHEPELNGPDGARLLAWFEIEHDNMHAALGWLLAAPGGAHEVERVELALRFCAALWQLWKHHGHITEGRQMFTAAAERVNALVGGAAPDLQAALRLSPTLPALWAKALSGVGIMASEQGDSDAARAWHAASLALRRQLGNKVAISASLFNLGTVARTQGDYDAAYAYQLESLALARELDHKVQQILALNSLGIVASDRGNDAAAQLFYLESLALAREVGDAIRIGMILNNLGIIAHFAGDYAAARHYFAASLAAHRESDDKVGVAYALVNLALVALEEGKYDEARSLLWDSLALLAEIGDKRVLAECLEGLAGVAGAMRQSERAARLFGAAETLREIASYPLSPSEQSRFDHYLAIAQAPTPPARWEAARAEGRAMTVERMVAYARGHGR